MQTRIARFHNIYGPYGTWKGALHQRSMKRILLCYPFRMTARDRHEGYCP
jgi:hypothetical protein